MKQANKSDRISTRQRRKEERPAEIVEAARAAFVDKGFQAARIEDIAKQAGVSKGLIYLYFPTKEALFEAVIGAAVSPILDGAAAVIAADKDTPAPQQLRMLIETVYREVVGTDRKRLLHMIIAEGPRFPEIARYYHREVVSKARGIMRALIERGVARGEFRKSALGDYPEIVIAPLMVAAIWSLLFEAYEPIDRVAYAEAHLDTMLRALAA